MTFKAPPPTPPPPPTQRSTSGSVSSSASLSLSRRKPMIVVESKKSSSSSARIGEIAGGTAAECAAVCCCCPCGIVGLVVCAVVKLPAGLCRRVYMKRRRRRSIGAMKKKGASAVWGPMVGSRSSYDDYYETESVRGEEWGIPTTSPSPEVVAMEREMLARFYSTGFWRSPSQREEDR